MKIISKLFFVGLLVLSLALATSLNNIGVYAQSDRGADQSMQGMAMGQPGQREAMDQSGQMGMDQSGQMGMDQSGQMAMDQSGPRQPILSGPESGQMAMDQSGQGLASNLTAAANYFYLPAGSKTIFIYTYAYDNGWTDLCGKKWQGSYWGLSCFGTKNWNANGNGFATATFYVSAGYYQYFDSCAKSFKDGWWNYGISYQNAYADHFNNKWQKSKPAAC